MFDEYSDFGGFSDYGVTNNTETYVDAPPDASGGTGSFLSGLLPTLTNGLSAVINSKLLNSLGGQSSLYAVDAYGNLVPKAAVSQNSGYGSNSVFSGNNGSAVKWALLALAVGGGLLLLVKR